MNLRSSYLRLLSAANKQPANVRSAILIVALSLAAAGLAVTFMSCINAVFHLLFVAPHYSKLGFVIASFCIVMGTSFGASLLLRAAPEAGGSGIPQAKAAYWNELGYIPFKKVVIKFFAGILSIGGGASLGREGPTVYLGSGIASLLSGVIGSAKRQRRPAAAMGAAAGLAAAFNTPMAAITFIIEELVKDLNTRYLGRVVLASLIGAITVHALLGNQPAFVLPTVDSVTWYQYFLVIVVAALAGLASVTYQNATLMLREKLKSQRSIPGWLLPCCGGFLLWIVAISAYLGTGKIGVFGLGYSDLSQTLHQPFVWWVAGILVAAKLGATIISYGFGGCGGIFSPTLFIGGMIGTFVSGLASLCVPLTPSDYVVTAAVGMSACMGGVIRAPLTSTLIVFEMTHQFQIVPGLMLGAVVSQAMVKLFGGRHNFYDALLLQDGHELIKISPPRDLQSWQSLPVSHIINRKPVFVTSTEPSQIKEFLSRAPYERFPYINDKGGTEIITRASLLKTLTKGEALQKENAAICYASHTVREASERFLESPSGMILVCEYSGGPIVGLLTLHDLLRAQAAVVE